MRIQRLALCSTCILSFFVIASGCGTVGYGGKNQVISVLSDPPGAEVYYEGHLIAHAPNYVEIHAEKNPSIFFSAPGSNEKTKINLKTKYRWKRSFFSNLVFLGYAPIGWATDLISGGAWEVESPKKFRYESEQALEHSGKYSKKIIAIAPPSIFSTDFSDQVGLALENVLKENETYEVLSYRETAPLFHYYSAGMGLPKDENDRKDLFYALNNDLVLVSSAKILDDYFDVATEVRDAYSGKVISKATEEFYSSDLMMNRQMQIYDNMGNYFYISPNTLLVNFGSSSQRLTINGEEYEGKITAGEGIYESASQVIERVSLSRVEPFGKNTIGHWSFSFLPDFNLSTSRIEFNEYFPAKGVKFKRTLISAGYGPRVSYVSYWGSPYLEVVPQISWTRVKTSGASINANVSESSFITSSEIGYFYYLNRNLILKLFVRTINEDTHLWSKVFSKINQSKQDIDSNLHSFAGVSVGYTFGIDRNQMYLKRKAAK